MKSYLAVGCSENYVLVNQTGSTAIAKDKGRKVTLCGKGSSDNETIHTPALPKTTEILGFIGRVGRQTDRWGVGGHGPLENGQSNEHCRKFHADFNFNNLRAVCLFADAQFMSLGELLDDRGPTSNMDGSSEDVSNGNLEFK